MKREVLCVDCAREMRALFPTDSPYPGEFVRFVAGDLNRYAACDHCCGALHPKMRGVCISIYTIERPYFSWENDFLEGPTYLPPGDEIPKNS